MRNPNRILKIIALLQAGWQQVPDWRFGQLVENLKRYSGKENLYYMEDDDMEKLIIDFFDLDEKHTY
jgi:uncharacterized protein YihD (DUF1040 family)